MYRVQKELIENGNGKAIFDFSLVTAFRVVENVSEKYLEKGFGAENTQEKSKKHPRKAQETNGATQETTQETDGTTQETTQEIILRIMEEKPEITQRELAQIIGITINGIKYHIKKMTNAGIIKHEGPTKSGKWVIKRGLSQKKMFKQKL